VTMVDTTVWVDYFRGTPTPEVAWLENAIADDADLCVCGTVLTEVLKGVRSDAEYRAVRAAMDKLVYLETSRGDHMRAAQIYRAVRKNGQTVRNKPNCITAACAIAHNVPLLQSDRDFQMIASVSKLRLIAP